MYKLPTRSCGYGFLKTFVFRIFNLLSREVVFLAVFMKNMVDPLGINLYLNLFKNYSTSLYHFFGFLIGFCNKIIN